jgi:hypothetical protein
LPLPIEDQKALPALQEYQFSKDSNGEPTLVSRAEYQFAGRMRLAGYGPEGAYGKKSATPTECPDSGLVPAGHSGAQEFYPLRLSGVLQQQKPYGRFLRNPGMGSMARAKNGSAKCHVSRSVLCDPGRPSPLQFRWMLQKLLHT